MHIDDAVESALKGICEIPGRRLIVVLTDPKAIARVMLPLCLLIGGIGRPAVLAQTTLNEETFAALRAQIRPQPGESRWMEIPWLIDVHEARQQAAALGKPIFMYSGGGATGIGPC